jgi:hypothetical protein
LEIKQEIEKYKLNQQMGIFVDEEIRESPSNFVEPVPIEDKNKPGSRGIQASGSPKSVE